MDFRCPSRIHFIKRSRVIEVKCHSKHCGAGGGAVVLHTFNIDTGELLDTKRFADPAALFASKGR